MRFDTFNPWINFIYFTAAAVSTLWFSDPVYLAISFVMAFACSVKLGGKNALKLNLALLPLVLLYGLWYGFYTHFGVTVIGHNFAGNAMTLESHVYGLVRGVKGASLIMWASCMIRVITADKVMYALGKVSPKLSLFLAILMRWVLRIAFMWRKTASAQGCIGKGGERGFGIAGISRAARTGRIVLTQAIDSLMMQSQSMKSRGYSLKGRTAYSIYRFDNRDRALVLLMALCITLTSMAAALGQTQILYNPEIIMHNVTWLSCVFYAAYGVLLAIPLVL